MNRCVHVPASPCARPGARGRQPTQWSLRKSVVSKWMVRIGRGIPEDPVRTRLCFGLLIPLVIATIAAQGKPDFSGRWLLIEPGTPPEGVALELVVSQILEPPATVLTVERRTAAGSRTESHQIGISGGVSQVHVVRRRSVAGMPKSGPWMPKVSFTSRSQMSDRHSDDDNRLRVPKAVVANLESTACNSTAAASAHGITLAQAVKWTSSAADKSLRAPWGTVRSRHSES